MKNIIYRENLIFPDNFFKKYTQFSNFKEFLKVAKKYGIDIKKAQYTVIKSDKYLPEKDFFTNYTNGFNTLEEFMKKGMEIYPLKPPLLPISVIKKNIFMSGFSSPITTDYWCISCTKKHSVLKKEVVENCSCGHGRFSLIEVTIPEKALIKLREKQILERNLRFKKF